MLYRRYFLAALLACFSFSLLNVQMIKAANAGQQNAIQPQHATQGMIYGKVTETFNASGYTYAEIDTGEKKVWGAARTTPLKIGDMIAFSSLMPMKNFHSKSLKRDFSVVYFVDHFVTDKKNTADNNPLGVSPHAKIKHKQVNGPVKGIKKVKGGNTIAEIYDNKANLKGKTVRVRGKVTKYTASVMGKNWIHIKDSSSSQDLTVTTDSSAAIDDIVVIEGKLVLDKDFNYGYVYPVIVEEAIVMKKL